MEAEEKGMTEDKMVGWHHLRKGWAPFPNSCRGNVKASGTPDGVHFKFFSPIMLRQY